MKLDEIINEGTTSRQKTFTLKSGAKAVLKISQNSDTGRVAISLASINHNCYESNMMDFVSANEWTKIMNVIAKKTAMLNDLGRANVNVVGNYELTIIRDRFMYGFSKIVKEVLEDFKN